jgi:hypothetical protein
MHTILDQFFREPLLSIRLGIDFNAEFHVRGKDGSAREEVCIPYKDSRCRGRREDRGGEVDTLKWKAP